MQSIAYDTSDKAMSIENQSAEVQMMDMDYDAGVADRAAKLRRTRESAEWGVGRGVAPFLHQISMDSTGGGSPCSLSVLNYEEGSRHVSESSSSDGDTEDGEFSDDGFSEDDFSDDDEEGVDSITVDYVSEETSGEEAGRVVGDGSSLRKFAIKGETVEWNNTYALEWFEGVCKGIARNRSIRQLSFKECDFSSETAMSSIATLSPFIELNPNLSWLEIVGCNLGDEGTRRLASSLSRRGNKISLQRIILDANNIGDEAGKELLDALRGYSNLREISLGDNELGTNACMALSNLLSSPNTKLKQLNVENNQIDGAGIAILTDALAGNSVLTELNLSFNCSITQKGWQTFAKCLRNPDSALEVLDLSSTNITDEGAVALGRGLLGNKKLKALYLCDISADAMPLVTGVGWRALFACLHNEGSVLEQIDIRYSSIDEGGLSALTSALAHNSSLEMVDLSHNKQITAAAWRLFFPCLGSPNTALKEVNLCGNNITDKDMSHLARSLHGNKRLETLGLGNSSAVTDAGWGHFSKILCNTSSAAAVHSSNHTLRSLGEPNIPGDLDELLLLNSRCDERIVSQEKILRYHFQNGKRNMREIAGMDTSVIPHAISWAGRNDSGRTILYELLRSLPPLAASANMASVVGRKRKRSNACIE